MNLFSDGSDTDHYRNIIATLEEKLAKLDKQIKELKEENEALNSALSTIRDLL